MSSLVDQAIQKIEQIKKAVEEAAKQTIDALKVGDEINDKTVQRNMTEFCTNVIEQAATTMGQEIAANVCMEQIASITGLKGEELGDHVKKSLIKETQNDNDFDFGRALSMDFDKLDLDKQDSSDQVGDVENIDMRR